MESLSHQERRRRLARRHSLAIAAADVESVATDLIGLHSSDPATVFLSCRARVGGFAVADLEEALYEARTLLRVLGMRRTMFVLPPELAAVVNAACTRSYIEPERRRLIKYLEDQGVAPDGDAWLAEVSSQTLAKLGELGEATATELREHVPKLKAKLSFGEGKAWGGHIGVSTRVLFLLATSNRIVRARPRGSWLSSQYRWALLDRWLPPGLAELDAKEAEQDLARRWLHAFGPGTLLDLKWWTGWPVTKTRRVLEAIDAKEIELEGDGVGYVLPDDCGDDTEDLDEWVALLPSLDPTVMGWKERDWYVGNAAAESLFDRNGNAGPTVWANGRVVGGWALTAERIVKTELLEPVGGSARDAIQQAAASLQQWFGETRFTPRFRTPLEKRLLG